MNAGIEDKRSSEAVYRQHNTAMQYEWRNTLDLI